MSFIESMDDIKEISCFKRIMEYTMMDRDFHRRFNADSVKAVESIGLEPSLVRTPEGGDDTHAAQLYDRFIKEKLKMRDDVRNKGVPSDEHFAKWRDRQIKRSYLHFPKEQVDSIVHISLGYELSSGCSVGCKFCGLNAGPLKKLFRATDENKELWKGIMDAATRVLGPAAGGGMLYYATEPLDNPDYEYFMDDWKTRFGNHCQITTAAATRDIERTHKILSRLDPTGETIFRFSVKSIEEFRTIMNSFTPEELLLVELLPQFEEAPGNVFAKAGRNVENNDYNGSISCISGLLVNLCDRTIKLLTPVEASEKYPLGQVEVMKMEFSDAEDFEHKLKDIIASMKTILSPKDKLKMYDYLEYGFEEEETCVIYNNKGNAVRIENAILKPFMEKACAMLKEGIHTRKEIGEAMTALDEKIDPVSIYSIINKLWNSGVIYDEQLFG